VVNHNVFNWAPPTFQFQPELFFNRREHSGIGKTAAAFTFSAAFSETHFRREWGVFID
jgi:hypothetical protein